MVVCQKCGADNQEGAGSCRMCGSALVSGMRHCVSCGRSIGWDANVCPYCGHDFMAVQAGQGDAPMSTGMKALLYLVSFFIWIAGIIIGLVYMSRPGAEEKRVGKICLILGVVSIVLSVTLAAALYVVVVGFGEDVRTTPTTTLSKIYVDGGVRFTFGPVTDTVSWSCVTLVLTWDYGASVWDPVSSDLTGVGLTTKTYPARDLYSLSVTLQITDLSGNGEVNAGDSFTLTSSPAFSGSTTYEVIVVYEPTDQDMARSTFTG